MCRYIAYYRVSTESQGRSGLGLEAQQAAVMAHVAATGQLLAEFTEIESGRATDRPQLQAAIARARGAKATLVIAKLDRLARNVAFISSLMESGIEFVCCDLPAANRLTIHILAAVAEDEARRISERTKDALAAAKARGVKLGCSRPGHIIDREKGMQNGLAKATAVATAARRQARIDSYSHLMDDIRLWRANGCSLAQIANRLNARGDRTVRGSRFVPATVQRLLEN